MYKLIAHRGIHNNYIKENTYLAINMALNNKNVIGVELDIRITKDNKIVVIHDAIIDRTSNGRGKVSNMTLNELRKYNFGSKKFYQSIPTLDKILDIKTDKLLLIEIKCTNDKARLFADILNKYNIYNLNNIYFISFNKKVLDYLDNKYNKGHITIKKLDNKYNILIINKMFYKKYSGKKKLFLYTMTNYKEINNRYIYYICDNIEEIIKKIST